MASTTVSSAMLLHGMYCYIVTNYGNPASLRHDIWLVGRYECACGILTDWILQVLDCEFGTNIAIASN